MELHLNCLKTIRRNNTSYNLNFRYNVKNEKYLAIDNIYIFRENV